jgi:UDP-glucose 4-epimerase
MKVWMDSMVSKYDRICVTGGAGFIGSHLVDRLLDESYEVIVIDNLSTGKLENIEHNLGKKNFQFVNCDIRKISSTRGLVKGADVIFHEAASTSVNASVRNPALTNSINVAGTLNLLKAALDSNVKRFVYASSVAVCGDVSPTQREDSLTRPISPYGVSKLAAENYVNIFYRIYGLETICLRYFNVYGSRQDGSSPYSGVITRFIERLLKKKPLIVYGDGEQSRDFISVEDVVEANMLAMKSKEAAGEILNVGTGKSTTINELAEILLKLANGDKGKVVHAKPRQGDVRYSQAETAKALKILGFKYKHDIKDELPNLVEWYKTALECS